MVKSVSPILLKKGITFVFLLIIVGFQLFQRYTWTEITGRSFSSDEILIRGLGYGIFFLLSGIVYWFHDKYSFDQRKLIQIVLIHLLASFVFALAHSLLFSVVYYISNPIWQNYSFLLLYQDVILNYLTNALIFYWVAVIFSEVYNRLFKTQSPDQNTLAVKDQGKTYLLEMADIHYLLSADNYVKVISADKEILTRDSMANLEKKLDPSHFLRIHRTALVNRAFISQINRTPTGEINLVMKDATVLPMSRRRKEVKTLLTAQLSN